MMRSEALIYVSLQIELKAMYLLYIWLELKAGSEEHFVFDFVLYQCTLINDR